MTINNWPLKERPREKLLNKGAASLSEAELLAIFLRTGTKGLSAVDIARTLLEEHKSLKKLLGLTPTQLMAHKGIGKAKYTMLQAALELGRRYLEEELHQPFTVTKTLDAKKYLIAKLSAHRHEIFGCLFLDTKNQVIAFEEIFTGTLSFTPIYPRVIAQKALEYNAGAVIFAHNHPSGSVQPSQSDIDSTKELVAIMTVLDIRVLDHIVIGGNKCSSFAELGLL
jgi:DNA repair protein RadC